MAATSAEIGRGAWAEYCGRTYPMLWLVAVGPTGLTRKEQVARGADRLLAALGSGISVLRDVSSGEALVEGLKESPHALLLFHEMSLLTDRARSRETRLLGTKLLELYDMPDRAELRRVARGHDNDGRVVVEKPTLGVIATGTPTDLVPIADLARNGLLNRFLVLPMRECPPVPRPAAPTDQDIAPIARAIRQAIDAACRQGAYPFSAEAARWWDDLQEGIYVALRQELRGLDEIERACLERRERHVVVLATLCAILRGHHEITLDDLERAQTIVYEANERLLGLLGSMAAEEPAEAAARRAATVQGYVRLVDLIRYAGRPLSQVALAELAKLPRATVQRRLADLERAGLVRWTDEGYVPVGGAQVPSASSTEPSDSRGVQMRQGVAPGDVGPTGSPEGGQVGSGHPPTPTCPTSPEPSPARTEATS
jgi:hypothetical protein